jgi:hypothetical protein
LSFVKEAENAMVPMLMERYGAATSTNAVAARAARTANRREFGASPTGETK